MLAHVCRIEIENFDIKIMTIFSYDSFGQFIYFAVVSKFPPLARSSATFGSTLANCLRFNRNHCFKILARRYVSRFSLEEADRLDNLRISQGPVQAWTQSVNELLSDNSDCVLKHPDLRNYMKWCEVWLTCFIKSVRADGRWNDTNPRWHLKTIEPQNFPR